ncbi:MAG: GGDEF domain-containing protein [Acidobacteriota bacterium]|nr:GGDEF domain-containing protein [Acidobacteriota bacterium]
MARDEHAIRVWAGMALWVSGATAAMALTVIGRLTPTQIAGQHYVAAACAVVALLHPVLVLRLRGRALYIATNVFSTFGAAVVWACIFWSGGAGSAMVVLYFLPSFYDAYFFRPRHLAAHLSLTTALVLSPLLYDGHLAGTQFPSRAAVALIGLWVVSAVISNRKGRMLAAERSARREARHDPLTDVLNVRGLQEQVALARPGPGAGLLLLDIDNFKELNSHYGHVGADRLLSCVGSGLTAAAGDGDHVARIGGDEFVVLAARDQEAAFEALARACADAVEGSRAAAQLSGPEATCSAGIALWGRDGTDLSELLAAADRNMYAAKAMRRARNGAGDVESPPVEAVRSLAEGPAARTVAPARDMTAGGGEDPAAGHPGAGDGPIRAWRRRRSRRAMMAAAVWMAVAALALLTTLAPYGDRSHLQLVLWLTAASVAIGISLPVFAPRYGALAQTYAVVGALPAVSIGLYATGGTSSPMLPAMLLAVTFSTYFLGPRAASARVLAVILVCATPFLYASHQPRIGFVVSYAVLLNTALVLAGILVYCRRELEEAERASRALAQHDPLTGLCNRRAFYERLEHAVATRSTEGLAVAIVDLDNFKLVNDLHGHAAGDATLIAIARTMRSVLRSADCLARIGGDEFAVMLRGMDAAQLHAAGERLILAVEAAAVSAGHGDCHVSATMGYAICSHDGHSPDCLVEAADQALMGGKDAGKHRVICASRPSPAAA